MTDPQFISALAGGFLILSAGTQIGVRIICDRLLNNGGKVCPKHSGIEITLKQLKESHKEEAMVEMIAKALERNGK